MNKEFRIWNIEKKCWMVKHSEHSDSEGYGWIPSVPCEEMNFPISLDWMIDRPQFWTVQQYIKVKDKDGKKIFEGDVLTMPSIDPESTSGNAIFFVEFKYGTFGYTDVFTKKFEPIYGLIGNTDKDAEATVIGNIFNNPDLLK